MGSLDSGGRPAYKRKMKKSEIPGLKNSSEGLFCKENPLDSA